MNNLAAFYSFLDQHGLHLLIYRTSGDEGAFNASVGGLDVQIEGVALYEDGPRARGATANDAIEALAAKLAGKTLIIPRARKIEQLDEDRFTFEVAHG